jgi:ABC-type uncharacterized transport system ATPase subunit
VNTSSSVNDVDVSSETVLADMRQVTRRFGDTVALDGVNLELRAGEIHALLGANGAGKTTLMRILAGLDSPNEGSVEVLGQPVENFDPGELRERGVALVQQHFTLVPTLTASENLILARPTGALLPNRRESAARLDELAERYGLSVRDGIPAGDLSVGEQQRLELLRALDADAKILLLDEPTAVLTDSEAERLLDVAQSLASQGMSLVMITHRLAEVAACDRVTVLREGREVITNGAVADYDRSDLASAMIGSETSGTFTQRGERSFTPGTARLKIEDLSLDRVSGLFLTVGVGEIVGIAGVDGNGQSEVEAALSGRVAPEHGAVSIDGAPIVGGDPRARRAQGLAYIPSDRYSWGLIQAMELSDNLELGRVPRIRPPRIERHTAAQPDLDHWDVRAAGPHAKARSLSGGNAQKLVLARELVSESKAVLACYPTRGLDPEAADTVATRLVEAAEGGAGILWIGAELDELLAVADRIEVLSDGALFGPFLPPFDREAIGLAMAGGGLLIQDDQG